MTGAYLQISNQSWSTLSEGSSDISDESATELSEIKKWLIVLTVVYHHQHYHCDQYDQQ